MMPRTTCDVLMMQHEQQITWANRSGWLWESPSAPRRTHIHRGAIRRTAVRFAAAGAMMLGIALSTGVA